MVPALFVIAKNINRRHLTASQRGMIVAEHLLPTLEREAAKRKAQAKDEPRGTKSVTPEAAEETGEAAEQAAKAAGVGKTTVKEAKMVADADPELAKEVLAGKKSIGQARREIKERELGVNRVPMPFALTVKDIIHQNGVPENTAAITATTHVDRDETRTKNGKFAAFAHRA